MKRRLFQWFTVLLLIATVWMAYANVLSDDTAIRAQARVAVDTAAGCGDACRIERLAGERGMIEERIEYDVLQHGHYVVVCRRAYILAGDYTCVVKEGKIGGAGGSPVTGSTAPPASGSSAPAPSGSAARPRH